MRFFYPLLLVLIFYGCSLSGQKIDFDPLRWQQQNIFSSQIIISEGWSVRVNPSEKEFLELMKLKDFNVKCTIVNKGSKAIRVQWTADSEEEKQAGKIDVEFEDREIRTTILKTDERVRWFVGKIDELINHAEVVVSYDGDKWESVKMKFVLQLEFEDIQKLGELVDISILEFPLSGGRSL